MEARRATTEPTYRRRVKIWRKEIAVAIALTLAALAFLAVSQLGGGADSFSSSDPTQTNAK